MAIHMVRASGTLHRVAPVPLLAGYASSSSVPGSSSSSLAASSSPNSSGNICSSESEQHNNHNQQPADSQASHGMGAQAACWQVAT